MASFARIALANGLAAPVTHNFDPATNDSDGIKRISSYEDRVTGTPVSFGKLAIGVTQGTPVRTVRIAFRLPTMEAVAGAAPSGYQPAPKEAFYETVTIEFKTHQRGTADGRKDLVAYAKNILSNASIVSVIVDGDSITG